MTSPEGAMDRDAWPPPVVGMLGLAFDAVTLEATVAHLAELALARRRGEDRPLCQVATVNVDFLVNVYGWGRSVRHPELRDVLRRAGLVVADGMPLVWLSRLLGAPLPERVAGSDLVPALAARAAQEGLSLYLLGGREGVAQRAAEVLQRRYPGLVIAGWRSPMIHTAGPQLPRSLAEDEALVAEINASGADVLLVGLGNPKQELWIDRNRSRLAVAAAIGVGGTYEFIAGTVSRAPVGLQRAGLEWLYRLTRQPRRLFKRYAVGLVAFGHMAGRQLWGRWWHGRGGQVAATLSALRLEDPTGRLVVDCQGLKCLHPRAQGQLLRTWRQCWLRQRPFWVVGVEPALRRSLAVAYLDDLVAPANPWLRRQGNVLARQLEMVPAPLGIVIVIRGRWEGAALGAALADLVLPDPREIQGTLAIDRSELSSVDGPGGVALADFERRLTTLGFRVVWVDG